MQWNKNIGNTLNEGTVQPQGFHKHDDETLSVMGKMLTFIGIPVLIAIVVMIFL